MAEVGNKPPVSVGSSSPRYEIYRLSVLRYSLFEVGIVGQGDCTWVGAHSPLTIGDLGQCLATETRKSYSLSMDEVYFLVEECAEGGYTARALGFPIFTQAETLEAIREHIKDAVDCHFDADKPKVLRLHFVRDEILAYAQIAS